MRVTRWRAMPASRKNELLDRNAKTGGWDLMDGKLARGFTPGRLQKGNEGSRCNSGLIKRDNDKTCPKTQKSREAE